MRPRKVKRGDQVYEMRARKNGSQAPAPGQAGRLPNEAPSTPPTDRLGIPLPAGTASVRQMFPCKAPASGRGIHREDGRALVAFRSVRDAVHSVAEDEFLVAGERVAALRKASVPFEDLTESSVTHGKAAAG
jgi:hypothetical protein